MAEKPLEVLLVDHEEKDAFSTREMLSKISGQKFHLNCKSTYEDGLFAILHETYDICLLECHLGEKTGLDFLAELREKGCETPVILLTDDGDRAIDLEAMKAGAYDYLIRGQINSFLLDRSIRYAMERKRTERELINVARDLEKSNQEMKETQARILQQEKMASIGQLAAGVAHEINNPMGFISSNLRTLGKYADKIVDFLKTVESVVAAPDPIARVPEIVEKKKALKIDYILEDIQSLISESLEGADRVKKIVQDLKNFSHVDEAEYAHAHINECIDSTLNIVWNELKYKVELKKEFAELPYIKCYPRQLNQVFMNLLVNASHAIDKRGQITIRTFRENGHVGASISDTGSGIPADIRDKIFEPFFTTKPVGKGTGLGLSITYDIVKKHNGEITVDSEVGKGTTFTIKIPVVEPREHV